MKTKSFLQRALTIVGAFLTSAAISITALAGPDQGEGDNIGGVGDGTGDVINWQGTSVVWLAELYVASTEDGYINTSVQSLLLNPTVTDNVAYVGSMLYTGGLEGRKVILANSANTYNRLTAPAQTPKCSVDYDGSSIQYYDMPMTTAKQDIDNPFLDVSANYTTYIRGPSVNSKIYSTLYLRHGKIWGLPDSIYSIDYDTGIRAKINDPEFTKAVVNDLKNSMGDSILTVLKTSVSPKVIQNADGDITRIFPDSEDPVVEWAVVVTPYAVNTLNETKTSTAFWLTKDKGYKYDMFSGDMIYFGVEGITAAAKGAVCYLMDAYTQYQYNEMCIAMFSNPTYREKINDSLGISEKYLENVTDKGPLRHYVEKNADGSGSFAQFFYNIARVAYIDPVRWPDHLLGVYSPNTSTEWYKTSQYATLGGITIALYELGDPDIPIYTHTYTPGNPNPTIFTSQTDTVPPDKATYTAPSPTPEAIGAAYTPTGATTPTSPYPSGLTEGTPPTVTWDPENPPKEIHIKRVEYSGPPVYIHKYAVTVDDDSLADQTLTTEEKLKLINDSKEGLVYTQTIKATANTTGYTIPTNQGLAVAALKSNTKLSQVDYPTAQHDAALATDKYGSPVRPFSSIANKSWTWKETEAPTEIHVMTIDVIVTTPPPGTDRIKTYDLTQFIDQTPDSLAGGTDPHLGLLTTYADNEEGYNRTNLTDVHGHVSPTSAAVMVSKPLVFATHQQVQATNYLSRVLSTCAGGACINNVPFPNIDSRTSFRTKLPPKSRRCRGLRFCP